MKTSPSEKQKVSSAISRNRRPRGFDTPRSVTSQQIKSIRDRYLNRDVIGISPKVEEELLDKDLVFLRRSVELAAQGVAAGDQAFGSVLVSASGRVLFEDHNHVSGGDHTQHPELAIAQWAVKNLTPEERATSIVYTSGEHCPMCAAAHAWVGLGPIFYAASSAQLTQWLSEWGLPLPPVAALPIAQVAPAVKTFGPFDEFSEELKELHKLAFGVI